MEKTLNIKEIENNLINNERTINCLLKSEKEIKEGKTRKAKEVIKEFKEKYGF